MAKKIQRGLGRGLGALLGEDVVAESAPVQQPAAEVEQPAEVVDAVRMLPIHLVDPNREQPRRSFDEAALNELAASIRAVGVLQPIIVAPSGERFTIIAGERRYRAARLAELDEIPAIVRDWDSQKRLEAALIENLQRDDLNPVEEAMGVRQLMDEAGLTQEKVAERLGKSRPAVANLLRLLNLPESVRQLLIEGKLSAGHARAIMVLKSAKLQEKAAQKIIALELSVRQAETLCKNMAKAAEKEDEPEAPKPLEVDYVAECEKNLSKHLNRAVKITRGKRKGKFELEFYGDDDLQRLYEALEKLSI